jgi:hypothetical protein
MVRKIIHTRISQVSILFSFFAGCFFADLNFDLERGWPS